MFEAFAFALELYVCLSLQEPAVVSHHTGVELPLISVFHHLDISVKSFPVLIVDIRSRDESVKSASSMTFWHPLAGMLLAYSPQARHNYLICNCQENSGQPARMVPKLLTQLALFFVWSRKHICIVFVTATVSPDSWITEPFCGIWDVKRTRTRWLFPFCVWYVSLNSLNICRSMSLPLLSNFVHHQMIDQQKEKETQLKSIQ